MIPSCSVCCQDNKDEPKCCQDNKDEPKQYHVGPPQAIRLKGSEGK